MQPRPLRHATDVHEMFCAQLVGFVHVTSHAHELPHDTSWHESVPVHDSWHAPAPHCTFWHDCRPEHTMPHDSPCVQLMPWLHEPSLLQSIVQ